MLAFRVIFFLSYFNMMFFIQHPISFIFVTKMGRHFEFPTFMHMADLALFISSFILGIWIYDSVLSGLPDENTSSKFDYA